MATRSKLKPSSQVPKFPNPAVTFANTHPAVKSSPSLCTECLHRSAELCCSVKEAKNVGQLDRGYYAARKRRLGTEHATSLSSSYRCRRNIDESSEFMWPSPLRAFSVECGTLCRNCCVTLATTLLAFWTFFKDISSLNVLYWRIERIRRFGDYALGIQIYVSLTYLLTSATNATMAYGGMLTRYLTTFLYSASVT